MASTMGYGQMVIHRHSNMTVYEYAKGPAGVFDETTQTWKDTCWVGTPGFSQGKALPKIIRRTIVKEGNIGVVYSDSSAYYGLQKQILSELEKRGELELTRPDGNIVSIPKSNKGKAFNQAKADFVLQQILADPTGTQVEGVFELKGGRE